MYIKSVSATDILKTYNVPELVQLACRFNSRILIKNNHCEFNAKSIMGMMSLDPRDGVLTITADGSDEEESVKAIVSFLTGK